MQILQCSYCTLYIQSNRSSRIHLIWAICGAKSFGICIRKFEWLFREHSKIFFANLFLRFLYWKPLFNCNWILQNSTNFLLLNTFWMTVQNFWEILINERFTKRTHKIIFDNLYFLRETIGVVDYIYQWENYKIYFEKIFIQTFFVSRFLLIHLLCFSIAFVGREFLARLQNKVLKYSVENIPTFYLIWFILKI